MNSFQKYSVEHPEESLKQIMLDHEIVFKNQVHELHRLYAVQKSLMKGDSKYTRCQTLAMKRTFREKHSVGSSRFGLGNSFLQEDQDFCSRFQKNPLDLRLSTGYDDDDDGGVLDGDEVNLSLSIGRSANKRSRIDRKSWKNKVVYPSSRDIIDLEDAQPVFSLDQSSRNSFHGMTNLFMNGVNLHQDHLKIDPSCRKRESLMNGGMHQEWSFFNQESNVKQTTLVDLDLNKDQPDESCFNLNEPLGSNPSSNDSYGESCSQISKPIKVSTSIPTSKQPKGQTSSKDSQTKTCTTDLESLPKPSSDLTEEKGMQDSYYTVKEAALSLISISLQETSTSNQDSETRLGSNGIENNDENKKRTIPQSCSIDSYESLVLKLEESSSIEEDCATSKAFKVNELDQKENGIKLRRGRRLKDFQKDILPTLSSLSRHEIWEDINILEGVIRSREYKRLNKAKMGKGENWFTSVRSKRSKVSYVGSRCCLRKKKSTLSYAAEKMDLL